MENDKVLWKAFLEGDDCAYSSIWKNYAQHMFSYGMCFTTDRELVKDCIQDVFVKIYKNRANLGMTDNIKFYLFVALKTCMYNLFRKNVPLCDLDSVQAPIFSLEDTPEVQVINEECETEKKEQLERMFEIITPRQKEVLYYRFVEDLSYSEISEIMGMNTQSVQNLVQRAIKKIRNTFPRLSDVSSSVALKICVTMLFNIIK